MMSWLPDRLRRWVIPVLVLVLLALVLRLLAYEAAHLRYHDILRGLAEIPRSRILLALLFTVATYLVLPGYDYLALGYAGHRLPWRRVAYGSTVTYGISQMLGFAALTGGSLRARLFTAWGLDSVATARAIAFSALTFTLGIVVLVAVVGVLEPAAGLARLHLPVLPIRGLAAGALLLATAYAGWSLRARGRVLHLRQVEISAPTPRTVALQVLVASLDWTFSALVLFVLLPAGHGVSFIGFLGAFLVAQFAGLVSHVPGGLGVFDTLMVLQVGGTIPTERMLGTLLVYRAVYYVLPFVVAVGLLVVHELRHQRARVSQALNALAGGYERWAEPLVPGALGLLTMLGGGVLLFSGATPSAGGRARLLFAALPLGVVELSHFAGSIAGAGLVVLGRALTRRLDAGYHLARLLLIVGIVASLLKGLDYEEATLLAVVLGLLVTSRKAFYRPSALLSEPLTPGWIVAILAIVGVSVWVGLFSFKHVEYTSELWWQFAERGDAPRFLRASAGAAAALVGFAAMRLLRHAATPAPPTSADALERVTRLLPTLEPTSAALALLGDKQLLLSSAGDGFLMYGVSGRTWVALGDPYGSEASQRELAWKFRESADRHGAWPVFYEVSDRHLPLYIDLGLTLLKMGEEAIVPLSSFSLEGGARRGLRHTRRELQKAGASFEVVPVSGVPALVPELRAISDEWLAAKATREKRFSIGRFDESYIEAFPIAVVRIGGRIVAFANVWTGNGTELSLDLMRYRTEAPRGVMEYLFTELMLWAREEKFTRMSLGMAPLSGLDQGSLAPRWHRMAGLLYRHGEHFYNFRGLRMYKEKFDPVWEPRYLATPAGLVLPHVLTNLSSLISGGITGLFRK